MSKPTVAHASFCCAKDRARSMAVFQAHEASHRYQFDEKWQVFQRCEPFDLPPSFKRIIIEPGDYAEILGAFGIQYPNETLSELTHGWGAPHFWAHHMVNHLAVLRNAESDYIVFADGDCYVKDQMEGTSWVDVGINTLENNPEMFLVSPSDGRPDGGPDRMMSQQMFLVNRKRFLEMEFIPWDGKFIEGGPFQEFYGLLEGWMYRHMVKHNLYRYVLPKEIARWWHLEWH